MKIGIDIDNVLSNFNEVLLNDYLEHDKTLNNIIKKYFHFINIHYLYELFYILRMNFQFKKNKIR